MTGLKRRCLFQTSGIPPGESGIKWSFDGKRFLTHKADPMAKVLGWIWLALFVSLMVYFYSSIDGLPDRLAVHFDTGGNPNGFQSKTAFTGTFPLFVLLINGVLAVFCWAIHKIPAQFINVPWKSYWLSTPERISQMNERMPAAMMLVGLFVNIVFFFAVHAIVQANSKEAGINIPINTGVLGIFVLSLFLLAALLMIFKPRGE